MIERVRAALWTASAIQEEFVVIYTADGELDGPTSGSQVPSISALPSEAVECPAALRSTSNSLSWPAPGDGTILPLRRTAAPLVNLIRFLERAY